MATANTRRNKDARKDDLYTTPPWAVKALLKHETFTGSLLDAGCGKNAITNVLVDAGYNVKGIDLHDHGFGETGIDFTMYNEMHDNVISNPPFTLLNLFILNAIKLARNKTAIFARINVLETQDRFEAIFQFDEFKPHKIYLFSNRVNCPKGGDHGDDSGSAVLYCWLVWDHSLPDVDYAKLYWLDDKAPPRPKKKRVKKAKAVKGKPADEVEIEIDGNIEIEIEV